MVGVALLIVAGLVQQPTSPPVPQPFPKRELAQPPRPAQQPPQAAPPTTPPRAAYPAAPPTATAQPCSSGAPTEAMLGVPIYAGAQFLNSYDAGRGQRFYLFGSSASFLDLVAYYRGVLKGNKGDLVFDAPATHEFDVGKFREETMAFPPGVTIKEYKSEISEGYPNPTPGCQPARFPTVIQIVPVPPTDR